MAETSLRLGCIRELDMFVLLPKILMDFVRG